MRHMSLCTASRDKRHALRCKRGTGSRRRRSRRPFIVTAEGVFLTQGSPGGAPHGFTAIRSGEDLDIAGRDVHRRGSENTRLEGGGNPCLRAPIATAAVRRGGGR